MPTVPLNINMAVELRKKLRKEARRLGLTDTTMIHLALREYLARLCPTCGLSQRATVLKEKSE